MSAATMTIAEVVALSKTFETSDAMLAKRVRLIHKHVAAGMTVKEIRDRLIDERTRNGKIVVVAATMYGYAKHAGDIVLSLSDDMTLEGNSDLLANLARVANKIGKKSDTQRLVDELLAPLTCDVAGKLEALSVWAETIIEIGMPAPAPKTREPRVAEGGKSDADDSETDAPETDAPTKSAGELTEREALAALHLVAEWIRKGGAYSANLESAVHDVITATSTARKRSRAMSAA